MFAMAALLAGSSAIAAPGGAASGISAPGGVAAGTVTPEPDTTPMRPMGAADRTANGPAPLATPPADVGGAPDPGEPVAMTNDAAPPAPAPTPQ